MDPVGAVEIAGSPSRVSSSYRSVVLHEVGDVIRDGGREWRVTEIVERADWWRPENFYRVELV